jgi:hypothetical protein
LRLRPDPWLEFQGDKAADKMGTAVRMVEMFDTDGDGVTDFTRTQTVKPNNALRVRIESKSGYDDDGDGVSNTMSGHRTTVAHRKGNLMSKKYCMIVCLALGVFAPLACKPAQCEAVIVAASPIQSLAMDGTSADLDRQAKQVEGAGAGAESPEIRHLIYKARALADLVKTGSQPGVVIPNYHEDKTRLVADFVDARRDVARVCQ